MPVCRRPIALDAPPATRRALIAATRPAIAGLMVAGVVLAGLTLVVGLHVRSPGGPSVRAVTALLYVLVGAACALLSARVALARATEPRVRRAWLLLAGAHASLCVADASWFIYAWRGITAPSPAPGDLLYIPYYPLVLIGLLSFPRAVRSRSDAVRFWMDALTVFVTVGMIVWQFVLVPIGTAYPDNPSFVAFIAAGPVGDVVLIFAAIAILLGRPTVSERLAVLLTVGGLLLIASGHLAYVVLQLRDGYPHVGVAIDGLWMCGRVLMAAGAFVQVRRGMRSVRSAGDVPAAHRSFGVTLIPYVAVAIGFGLMLWCERRDWREQEGGVLIGAVALTALVVARQIAGMRENGRLLSERARHEGEARLSALVQHSSDVVTVVRPDLTISYQSPSVERVFGYRADSMIGRSILSYLHPEDAEHAERVLTLVGVRPDTAPVEWRTRHSDGGWRTVETVVTDLRSDPRISGIVLNARDVTERTRLEAQLSYRAFHDELTGLANRALFADRLAGALTRAAHSGDPLAVLFIDLDDFKTVNDTFGHECGDALLRAVATRLGERLRPADTAARLGGDEFIVLLEQADEKAAIAAARALLDDLGTPTAVGEQSLQVRASIGIALCDGGAASVSDLLRNSDLALYRAKARGKGGYATYTPDLHLALRSRVQMEADLRHALERNEFELAYQPCMDLRAGSVRGFEALVRWRHPDRGVVMPGTFIQVAEESGLIHQIGRWVLVEACRQSSAWRRHLSPAACPTMNVNLSVFQLRDPRIVADIAAALAATGMTPSDLVLEITESAMMDDVTTMIARLLEIRALGVRLAIDDFGTGYSSLSYLQQFPIDVLKIDRSFVSALGENEQGVALVRAIVGMAQSLGLDTVAEGIEHAAQLDLLRALGCVAGQGYLFARPLPPAEAVELVRTGMLAEERAA